MGDVSYDAVVHAPTAEPEVIAPDGGDRLALPEEAKRYAACA